MTGDSRKKFDVFYRNIISGTDTDYPRPKSFKLGKVATAMAAQLLLPSCRLTCSLRGIQCLTTTSRRLVEYGLVGRSLLIGLLQYQLELK